MVVLREGWIVLLVAGVWSIVTGCGPGGAAAGPTSAASPGALVTASPLATRAVTTQARTAVAPASVPSAVPPAAPVSASPAPASQSNCTASPRNAVPGDGGDETITVRTTVGASVSLQVHYKTTTHPFSGVADSAGTMIITFSIGRPTPGYPVRVDVSTNSGGVCTTQFTPQ